MGCIALKQTRHACTDAQLATVSCTRVVSLTASLVAVGIHGDAITDITDVRVIVRHLVTENRWRKVSKQQIRRIKTHKHESLQSSDEKIVFFIVVFIRLSK